MKRQIPYLVAIVGIGILILIAPAAYNWITAASAVDWEYFSDLQGNDLQVNLSYEQLDSHLTTGQKQYLVNPDAHPELTQEEKEDLKSCEIHIFEVRIVNVSKGVVAIRQRRRVSDQEDHEIGERGEDSFQLFLVDPLFLLNSWGEKVALHHYYEGHPIGPTELDGPFKPGQSAILHYRLLQGDDDFERIGNRGVVAGVRYWEYDPDKSMSDEARAKLKSYVAWSNVVHLPDAK